MASFHSQTTQSSATSIPSSANTSMVMMPAALAPLTIRLDRSNYTFWRSQFLPSVKAHDLEGFLLGTRTPPPEFISESQISQISQISSSPTPNPDFLLWNRLDQFLMSWLMSSVSEPMLGHIIQCETSAEIWKVFEQLFSTRSKARILQLRFSLQNTRKGAGSVEEYILKMKNIAHSLAAAGQHIPDDELILYILGGLGSEFEAVVVNLTSRDAITLQEVQYLLQTHEMRLEHLASVSLTEVSHFESRTFLLPSRTCRVILLSLKPAETYLQREQKITGP